MTHVDAAALPAPRLDTTDTAALSTRRPRRRQLARRRLLVVALAAIPLAVSGLALHWLWPQRGDDTFIYLRYAGHLAAGQGLTWNPDERIEGFSSLLWVALLALGARLPMALLTWAKALGLFFALATVLVAWIGVTRATRRTSPLDALAVGLAGATLPFGYWAASGLETPLAAFLLTAATVAHGWDHDLLAGRGRRVAFGLHAALCLTRPEAPLLTAALVALDAALLAPQSPWRRDLSRRLLAPYTWPILVLLGATLFRRAYFGAWLPNTAHAKLGSAGRFQGGFDYLRHFFDHNQAVALLAVALLAAFAIAPRAGVSARAERMAKAGVVHTLALVAAAIYMGGDWMSHWRILAPATFPALLAVLCAVSALGKGRLRAAPLSFALVLLGLFHPHGLGTWKLLRSASGATMPVGEWQEGQMTLVHREVGNYLRARGAPGDVVAVNHAGALPYYSELPAIDMTGLNDRHIAHDTTGGLHDKRDAAYVIGCRPKFIVLNTHTKPTESAWYKPDYWVGETELFARPELKSLYRPIPKSWSWESGGSTSYTVVYERKSEVAATPTGQNAKMCWADGRRKS